MADHEQSQPPEQSPSSSPAAATNEGSNKATKDRSCPYCGQAFTSSSLGRHLDLYIKPKNPKPPDGVHDVEEIKRVRGGITRRQPRARAKSINGSVRRKSTGLSGDVGASAAKTNAGTDYDSASASPTASKARGQDNPFINHANWQATGVINDLPPRASSSSNPNKAPAQGRKADDARREGESGAAPREDVGPDSLAKLQEAAELGRAAEMALREVLGSLEAAQKKSEPKTLFPEVDFFSLSFPGMCLVLLPFPGTLFTPTPFPTPETWSITPPWTRQYEALNRLTNERSTNRQQSEPLPNSVLFRHHSHLAGAWEHWQSLTDADRSSAWTLEILRAFVRAQEKSNHLSAEQDISHQRIRHLEAEYDRLSRCQLPRDYLLHPPNTIPIPAATSKTLSSQSFQSGINEVHFNAESLIAKWQASIRASIRPPRPQPPQPSTSTPSDPKPHNTHSGRIETDFIMNGSVWSVGGPLPRPSSIPNIPASGSSRHPVAYETPPNPGNIVDVSMLDDAEHATDLDADADAEAEDDYPDHHGALIRRQHQHQHQLQQGAPQGDASLRDAMSAVQRATATATATANGELKRPFSAVVLGSASAPASAVGGPSKVRRVEGGAGTPSGRGLGKRD